MNGDWKEMLVRLLVAVALSAAIGYEREARGKAAGVRTHILIALGAAGFTLASLYGFSGVDVSRVASGVVAGVGFIGAGVIFRGGRGEGVAGLTTAASIWVTACIGLCAACGLFLLALVLSAVSVLVLELPKVRD
jgi:putative Mg2+ transporter-C (MgtC) family protein